MDLLRNTKHLRIYISNINNSHPLYQHLKKSAKGLLGSESIKWNFTKFLVDKQGNILERYAPTTKPEELNTIIEKLLS